MRTEDFYLLVQFSPDTPEGAHTDPWMPFDTDLADAFLDGDIEMGLVTTTNHDRGKLQVGMPICRYKRTVGWLDVEAETRRDKASAQAAGWAWCSAAGVYKHGDVVIQVPPRDHSCACAARSAGRVPREGPVLQQGAQVCVQECVGAQAHFHVHCRNCWR